MTTETTQTCKTSMRDGGFQRRPCGKKVKGQTDAGEWLCGVHLGAYNRVKKNRAVDDARRANNNEVRDDTRQILTELTERYGLEGRVFGSYNGTYTGEILVNGQQLQEILIKLTTN